jgi:predicted N-acetyltransferase YhbS
MQIEVRLLVESDIPAALRLKELAQWNQTEKDWLRLLRLEPNGCFCATIDGEVVATATTTTYRPELAWIGMVLVDPKRRQLGIATRVMKVALEYLAKPGVPTVKLDATPLGCSLYRKLGFKDESLIERWEGIAGTREAGSAAVYLGPLLATSTDAAAALLDGLLSQMSGQRIYIDLNRNFKGGRKILTERGFMKQRDLIRMFYGQASEVGSSPSIFAIAGPELG